MSFSHTVTYSWSSPTDAAVTQAITNTNEMESNLDVAVPMSTTNQEMDVGWTNSLLKSLFIFSDQTLTLYSNHPSGSAPDNTVTVTANTPVIYQAGMGFANPFVTADVTKMYVTNAGGSTANLKIRMLRDSTP
jgi:hypothetical protein